MCLEGGDLDLSGDEFSLFLEFLCIFATRCFI